MSVVALPARVYLELPPQWRRIPREAGLMPEWLSEEAPAAGALRDDLARVADALFSAGRPLRTGFAYVSSATADGASAFLTVDVYATDDAGYATYLAAAAAPGPKAYARQTSERTLGGMPAIVVRDYLPQQPGELGTTPLQERYLAVLFPPAESVMLELQLTTPDLFLFPDLVAYGDEIADTLRVDPR